MTPVPAAVRLHRADGTEATCGQVVLAAGAGIPALLGERGRDLGVPPVLVGRASASSSARAAPRRADDTATLSA